MRTLTSAVYALTMLILSADLSAAQSQTTNWEEKLGLTNEQTLRFSGVMNSFKVRLLEIDSDTRLNTRKKMEEREKARLLRDSDLKSFLSPEQMRKFLEYIRGQAHPGDTGMGGPPGNGIEIISTVNSTQKTKMASLLRWYTTNYRRIMGSSMPEDVKLEALEALKEAYAIERAKILTSSQDSVWGQLDGIPSLGRSTRVVASHNDGFPGGNPSEDGDIQAGPPNCIGEGKKTNRTSVRSPYPGPPTP